MTKQSDQPDMKRRGFIGKTVMAVGAVTVAPGVLLAVTKQGADEVSNDVRWGMLVDSNKCTDGCTACVDACNKENGIDLIGRPEGQSDDKWNAQRPQWIRKVKLKDKQTGEITNLPMMCQHCEHPPCVDVCPTGASFKRADGIVMVDRHTCIGCRYCMMACPYKARSFIHQNIAEQLVSAPRGKGCVESCNFCATRLDRGKETTACQDACEKDGHQAIIFGDLRDPDSPVAKALKEKSSRQIRADLELNTGVRYTNV
ncbi:sulfate reduction electron transfer complex DsrMKJOP subunit DsrO [Candidatus Vondammii sp. HM_W22]|uniref:sulfate reduction electron transfer complex DsrMKJOP subunit DsrO n=1 Tax=Candidatus Vondammii sp. HM_W22 TaxID=2687299 RepID=UPI001F142039|nr:4Fe-4S dicluster domain-containing protein [Candidatus Vondammii sp. HM_W22]